jgi:hypothetical protein
MDERQTGLTGLTAFMTAFMAGLLLTVPRKTVPRKTVPRKTMLRKVPASEMAVSGG